MPLRIHILIDNSGGHFCSGFIHRIPATVQPVGHKSSIPVTLFCSSNYRVSNAVDEHIAAQPEALRPKLEQVRAAIRRAVPEAVEVSDTVSPGTS